MKISHGQFFKYFYFSLLVLWFIVALHIAYLYIDYSSIKTPVKGGTFVEATTEKISYLPYISNRNNDKFYQSFLYNGCLSPYISGTDILYINDLCNVTTQDYKTFSIEIISGHNWSDGVPITLNDVYFTYKNILINNIWTIESLNNYQNIETHYTGNKLDIIFPYPSIDNQIFFTNFILPEHGLEGVSLEDYISNFGTEPISSGCAKLDNNPNDANSVVFNLSECKKTYIKYYQIKQFKDFNEFNKYIKGSKNQIIDLITSADKLDGFVDNSVILNKFITIFFNTSSDKMTVNVREAIANSIQNNIYSGDYEKYFVKDNFIFDAKISSDNLKKTLDKLQSELNNPKPQEKEYPNLPETIKILTGDQKYEYFKDTITTDQKINIELSGGFDKISITDNGNEYFLPDYKKGDKTVLYKVSESYKNIKLGENNYIIKSYSGNQGKEYLKFKIFYKTKPVEIPSILTGDQKLSLKINVIYYGDKTNRYIIDQLRKIFEKQGVLNYFDFQEYLSIEQFDGKVNGKEYDIVLKGIDMGLKKDISNIFSTDDVAINPSLYKNTDLASVIKQYFINKGKVKEQAKQELDNIYSKYVPLLILGKRYGSFNIRQDLIFSFPLRLYDYWFKKDSLIDIKLSYSLSLDMAKVFSISNVSNFFKEYLK